jgi:hypothetical protein
LQVNDLFDKSDEEDGQGTSRATVARDKRNAAKNLKQKAIDEADAKDAEDFREDAKKLEAASAKKLRDAEELAKNNDAADAKKAEKDKKAADAKKAAADAKKAEKDKKAADAKAAADAKKAEKDKKAADAKQASDAMDISDAASDVKKTTKKKKSGLKVGGKAYNRKVQAKARSLAWKQRRIDLAEDEGKLTDISLDSVEEDALDPKYSPGKIGILVRLYSSFKA